MAIPSRQIGWGTESNLLWQILKQLNKLTSVLFGLKEAATPNYKVYTALLTQNGGDVPTLSMDGPLEIGVTYEILDDDSGTVDFTNVGAPNNNIGTFFMATGTTPTSWGVNLLGQLLFNSGAPVAIVLENTIGNIWFTYTSIGRYNANSGSLFTLNKTYSTIESQANDSVGDGIKTATITYDAPANNIVVINTGIANSTSEDSYLINTPFEIRVYN